MAHVESFAFDLKTASPARFKKTERGPLSILRIKKFTRYSLSNQQTKVIYLKHFMAVFLILIFDTLKAVHRDFATPRAEAATTAPARTPSRQNRTDFSVD